MCKIICAKKLYLNNKFDEKNDNSNGKDIAQTYQINALYMLGCHDMINGCSLVRAVACKRWRVLDSKSKIRLSLQDVVGKKNEKKGLRRGQDRVGTGGSKEGGTMAALGLSFRGVNKKLV